MNPRHRTALHAATALVLAAGLALGATRAGAQSNEPRARFSAIAMDLDRGNATPLDIVVNRWSSKAEQERLMNTMFGKGADALHDALLDTPRVGYLQVRSSLGWDLRFAQRVPGEDGGERIVLITDRPLSFWETFNRPRSADYNFTVIEMRLKDGEGDGTLSLATRIIPDKVNNLVVLENYDMQRIRLTQVRRKGDSQ